MLPVLLLPVIFGLPGCVGGIVGNGDVETRTEEVGPFNRVIISGNFHVFLEQSSKSYLRFEMDENLFDILRIKETGSTLRIETEMNIIRAREKKIFIGTPEVDKLDLSGAVELSTDGSFKAKSLVISCSGAVELNLELETERLKLDLSGASDCNISGTTNQLTVDISGAGDFNARQLQAKNVWIDLSGAGSARVYASEELDVSISGVGSVRYGGDPTVHKNISGLGSLKRD